MFVQNQMILDQVRQANSQNVTDPAGTTSSQQLPEPPQRVELGGPFVSEQYRGLIGAGSTSLNSTIGYELSGPMEITFTSGTYTTSQGQSYELPQDMSFTIEPHHALNKSYSFHLIRTSEDTATVKQDSVLEPGPDMGTADVAEQYGREAIDHKEFDNRLTYLIGKGWLTVRPNETSLEDDEIPALHIWRPDSE